MLFLNNAINHGVLTPLGIAAGRRRRASRSCSCSRPTPAPASALLLAYTIFGTGAGQGAPAPGAAIIQFFGGIHEIYFPYVLMKPMLILGCIAGGMTGVATNVLFGGGLRAPAAPGSIIAVWRRPPRQAIFGVILSVLLAAATVSFIVCSVILRCEPQARPRGDGAGRRVRRGHRADGGGRRASPPTRSSACVQCSTEVGAATRPGDGDGARDPQHRVRLRRRHGLVARWAPRCCATRSRRPGIDDVTVVNKAIANLDGTDDLVVTHQDLTDRAQRAVARSAPRLGRQLHEQPAGTTRSSNSSVTARGRV